MRIADTIFLDFEGEGPKGPDRVPQLPFLAGLYRPKAEGRKSQFSVSLFREHCTPVKNGIPEISEITSLEAFITRITKHAETEGLTICYWSDHELAIIKRFLKPKPRLIERFEAISLNILPQARKYLRRLGQEPPDSGNKVLNHYLTKICPQAAPVSTPRVGAAVSCQRLERYSDKEKKWSNWSEQQKITATDLIRYNRDDCIATVRIAQKVLKAKGSRISRGK